VQVVIPSLECWLAESSSCALVGMLVEPDLTRAGIGTQLIAVAKRERPDGLRLWAFVSNRGAQRFYLRHGFGEVERTDGSDNEEGAPAIRYAWGPS